MKSRFDRNHLFHSRELQVPHPSQNEPQQPSRPSRSARPPAHRPNQLQTIAPNSSEKKTESGQELTLEDELPMSELNDFAFSCIEQLSVTKKGCPAEKVISTAIADKLPSYTSLKADFLLSHQAHQRHHTWTTQVYDAVEPLIKQEHAPAKEQQSLVELTSRCVERNMQLGYRVEQLRLRVAFLETAVPEHLVQIGVEIGLPTTLMGKIGKLVKTLMERHA